MADKEPAPAPEDPPKDGVITVAIDQLEGIVEKIVDKILGDPNSPDDDQGKPDNADHDEPRTDRETERSLRDQVKSAVAELERERQHDKEHEELKRRPEPPLPEVKPWRNKIWGE